MLDEHLEIGGLFAVDVSEPKNPKFAGCFGGDGYTHDAQCLVYRGPDVRYIPNKSRSLQLSVTAGQNCHNLISIIHYTDLIINCMLVMLFNIIQIP